MKEQVRADELNRSNAELGERLRQLGECVAARDGDVRNLQEMLDVALSQLEETNKQLEETNKQLGEALKAADEEIHDLKVKLINARVEAKRELLAGILSELEADATRPKTYEVATDLNDVAGPSEEKP
jgi:predicted  nucleic acid-binding Zn-ribbon protein